MNKGENLGRLLLERFRWFDGRLRASLTAAGWPELTYSQSLVFAYLDSEGTRPSELARRIGVTRQAVHQTVADLEALGLVRVEPDPSHGRAKIVALTDAGRDNVRAALGAFAKIEADLARRIGSEEVASLRSTLEADWGPVEASPPPD